MGMMSCKACWLCCERAKVINTVQLKQLLHCQLLELRLERDTFLLPHTLLFLCAKPPKHAIS